MKKNVVTILLMVMILVILLAGCGKDSKEIKEVTPLEMIKNRGLLYVGVKADFPPFGYMDEKGNIVGFEIDMAKRLAEDLLGDPDALVLVPVTGTNRIPYLQAKKIDIILATMGVTAERATQVLFSDKYFQSGVQLLVPVDSNIQTLNDLKGKKVIVVPGTTGDIGLSRLVPEAELVKLSTTGECLEALRAGRGVAFAQDNVLLWRLAKQFPGEFKVVAEPFNSTEWALAARLGETDIAQWINENLQKWQDEDYFFKLYTEWVAESMSDDVDPSLWVRRP